LANLTTAKPNGQPIAGDVCEIDWTAGSGRPSRCFFPLSVLAFGAEQKMEPIERLKALAWYCALEAGEAAWEKAGRTGETGLEAIRDRFRSKLEEELAEDEYDDTRLDDDCKLMLGVSRKKVLGFDDFGELSDGLDTALRVRGFIAGHEQLYGRGPRLFVNDAYLRDAIAEKLGGHLGTARSERVFAGLCAMLSCLGNKKTPWRITREAIQCRMMGYKDPKVLRAESERLANLGVQIKPLEVSTVGKVMAEIARRKFIRCTSPNRRENYYSFQHSQEHLDKAVMTIKAKRAAAKAVQQLRRASQIEAATKKIKEEKERPKTVQAFSASIAQLKAELASDSVQPNLTNRLTSHLTGSSL